MNIIEAYLTPNEFSRPQTKLTCVKGIVIHWVANPNSTGMANRNFFESRKNGSNGYGSAHDIIDLNGDLIRCLPYDELSYQVGSSQPYQAGTNQIYTPKAWQKLNTNANKNIQPYPNNCTVGVECTHIDWDGTMTPETYNTLLIWCVEKLRTYNLTIDDLYLHKEIVGWKDCHMFYVKNPNEWTAFKSKVQSLLNSNVNTVEEDEENMPMKIADWAWIDVQKYLGDAYNEGIITSWEWCQKANDKQLTLTEFVLVKVLIDERRRLKV